MPTIISSGEKGNKQFVNIRGSRLDDADKGTLQNILQPTPHTLSLTIRLVEANYLVHTIGKALTNPTPNNLTAAFDCVERESSINHERYPRNRAGLLALLEEPQLKTLATAINEPSIINEMPYLRRPTWLDFLIPIVLEDAALEKFDIASCSIGKIGTELLVPLLEQLHTLSQINLELNSLDSACASAIITALKTNPNLTELDLGCNGISDASSLQGLTDLKALKKLNLRYNPLKNDGIETLCEFISAHPALEELDLSGTQISNQGAIAIAQLLKTSLLKRLIIKNNDISSRGIAVLAEALPTNYYLQTLNIEFNPIDNDTIGLLINGLDYNLSLLELKIRNSRILDTERIKELLKRNRLINHLYLMPLEHAVDDKKSLDLSNKLREIGQKWQYIPPVLQNRIPYYQQKLQHLIQTEASDYNFFPRHKVGEVFESPSNLTFEP